MTLDEINHEIELLEPAEVNTRNVQVLSSLYIVRDNLLSKSVPDVYKMPMMSGTKFRNAVSGMSTQEFMDVMDELMSTLQMMYPKLYDSVLQRLM